MSTLNTYTISGLRLEDPPIDVKQMTLRSRSVTALVGPSGGGKTTLVKILCGLIEPTAGSWTYGNEDLLKLPIQLRRLGVVFQGQDLFEHLTARENVLLAAKFRGINNAALKADELFQNLEIESCIDRKAKVLSGGEKQRVALARALIGEPRVLILDEPFSALDSKTKSQAIKVTQQVILKMGVPTLFISHDLNEVSTFTKDVYEMIDGIVKPR